MAISDRIYIDVYHKLILHTCHFTEVELIKYDKMKLHIMSVYKTRNRFLRKNIVAFTNRNNGMCNKQIKVKFISTGIK